MTRCKDCGTFYRAMDHSVAACAEAGGKEAQRLMDPNRWRSMSEVAEEVAQAEAAERFEKAEAAYFGTTDAF